MQGIGGGIDTCESMIGCTMLVEYYFCNFPVFRKVTIIWSDTTGLGSEGFSICP